MNLKSKLPNLPESIFSVMTRLANEHDAINLSQGFPNFETSAELKELVYNAMLSGNNQYAPMRGDVSLRAEIAHKINQLYQTTYEVATEILVTAGATEALFNAITAFIHKDDEVILFKPAFDSYEPVIWLNGGKTIDIQLHYPDYAINWQEVASKITSKTKMIIINTPLNPTGKLFSDDDFKQLENIIKNTNIIVLSDEVYEHMTYDGQKHLSACQYPILKQHAIVTTSFGKTFHNTGWKVGYCVAPKYLMDEMVKIHEFNIFSVSTPFQVGFATFLKNSKNYTSLNDFFQQKRDLFLNAIQDSNFTWIPTQGTYFQLLKFDRITQMNDVEFAEKLAREHKIASIPISVFNHNLLDEKVLRFCFAKTDETLLKAAEILCKI